MKKWKCQVCGRTASAHPCFGPGDTQDCIGGSCGGTMVISQPPRKTRSGPPKLPRKGPRPGRCPVCLTENCADPGCAKYIDG